MVSVYQRRAKPANGDGAMNVIVTALDADALSDLHDLADGDRSFLDDLFTLYIDQANEIVAALRTAGRDCIAMSFRAAKTARNPRPTERAVANVRDPSLRSG
jgi:hypothetical protein